jgi:phage N-6-adenine-methyltransferase
MIQQHLFGQPQTELTSDDYYTPKWIFDTLDLHFDLDVASPPHRTHVPCDRYFTQEDDGLAQEWHGRVWLNPPFSQPSVWVDRWLQHANGVLLIQSSRAKWFTQLWDSEAAVVRTPHNLKFDKPGGPPQGIYMPALIWAIGEDNIVALGRLGKTR